MRPQRRFGLYVEATVVGILIGLGLLSALYSYLH